MKKNKKKQREELGTALRHLRHNSRLGIKPAAARLQMSYTYLSKIENGYKPPSKDLLIRLCGLYGADSDDFIAKLGELPEDILDIIRTNGKEVFELLRQKYSTGSRTE